MGQGLEEIEKSKKIENLEVEYMEKLKLAEEIIDELASEENKINDLETLKVIRAQGEEALKHNDNLILSRTIEQLIELNTRIIFSNPQIWIGRFNEIKQGEYNFSDLDESKYYLEKGEKALEIGDIDQLKSCVIGLNGLLSPEEVEVINMKSGITR